MKIKILFCIILSTFYFNLFSQTYSWISGGVTNNGIIGSGISENTFDRNFGFSFEFGYAGPKWEWIVYGINGYSTINKVLDSENDVTILVPYYTEVRRLIRKEKFNIYAGLGIAINRMQFEGMEGYDYQILIPANFGIQYFVGEKSFFQFSVKPYIVTGNQMDQDFGFEICLSFAYMIMKK